VCFLRVIKDHQYQLDIVLGSHLGPGDSNEAVALVFLKLTSETNFFERTPKNYTSSPLSPSVQIVVVQKEEITYKFSQLTVATQ
ncbi:hypothetical protein SK128_007434, partial [Halocaridina rubra]